ncbi:ATP-binding cassette domain-containing protein [Novosphingobium album (ex Liu et al. 2023)]|uniref:ATP-binding cassette domain-containing protein n=1 Tax=Novosphingobium album (ex Liu et al. 2023) TaxID=3031130 RepID=A0ABT5WVW9_9SPHN|nr:ATP-binding cassette domain-containing protein [Novosphingobium album (ex Liu et al. 2023)]MDE8654050.1 ATP-binding cassette domain-containing protein [Novosphingobium album (ex Liu et al. 2023)]
MKYKAVGLFWLLDVAGAALFAWGLALGVGGLVSSGRAGGLALAALVAGALCRGSGVVLVHRHAIAAAQAVADGWRARLLRQFLGGRIARPLTAGESATYAIDHVRAIEEHGARFQPARLHAALGPIAVIGLVAPASWVSALILLATFVPFLLGMILAGSAARHASERQLAALSALSGLFVDRIRHLPLIRHFAAEERVSRQVAGATREVAARTVAVLRAAFVSNAVLEFFAAIAVALVAVYCGFSLLGLLPFAPPETLTLAPAFFALAMAPEFYLPMRRLAAAYHEKQMGEAALGAIAAVLPPEDDAAAPATAARFTGLAVRDLALAWPGLAIGPLTFAMSESDFVVLTGPTGSGKTSTLAAIAGQIALAGGSVRDAAGGRIAPESIAWAAQRCLLLPGTLAHNIAIAAPKAAPEAIADVARRVGLGPMLERRGGLDLAIDHRGSGLSGGERRRIGLARAILSGRPLLLCDEPTADLDAVSAAGIVALLRDLARERCLLVATHDPQVIAAARLEIAL